jgi:AcrR family transcriptional regulator
MPRSKTISDDEVLSRAREVLVKQGAAVSTSEIAKHVGLSQATLFQRFGSKNKLLARALRPEPVEPSRILGPPGEYEEVGAKAHLALLAGRLFDAITGVMERLQVVTAAGMSDPEMSALAHDFADAEALVSAVKAHLSSLAETGLNANLMTDAILMLVHGAIAQSLQNPKCDREAVRTRLGEAVCLLL